MAGYIRQLWGYIAAAPNAIPPVALTETGVRNAKASERSYKLADAGGLFLFVTPAGGRHWRLKYRAGGKEKLLSIGPYPLIGLKAAREARDGANTSGLCG